ncbi:13763_t:CDS:10 [Acaulospora morrowiae]|uniref:13763_t:CDS:1 n=1 Tax=Acaulospora morrowiae TaxID=94023 RepID=A0A9N9A002_9GLOM|nr:13763_t:CDS:10 [Acaulospora morrowiae]
MSSQNKTRKRKWDLDDQGKEAPPSSAIAKSIKVESTSDASESSAPSPTPSNSDSVDPNIAAAVAAAKINAILAAKGIQVPSKSFVIPSKLDVSENGGTEDSTLPKAATKESDLEFVQDIVINDCKNRYTLTKGATQQQIQKETGADVTTRGKYYPDKLLATEKDPPLYLHVTASTKESLDAAIKKIGELMEQSFTPAPSSQTSRPTGSHAGGRQFVQDKVFVGIEPDRTFNARAKIVGPQGAYVKHIQQETGAKVQLKGRGSGYVEPTSGAEAFEPLHIHITCWSQDGLDKAKKLCEDLINTVKTEWDRHKAQQTVYPPYARSPTYGTSTANAYSAQSAAAYNNPYNPYNQSRYYQQYQQYNYYGQQTATQPTDINYYYGYAGYPSAVAYQTVEEVNTLSPTSTLEDKSQGGSYHAVPPPDSYDNEVGK